MTAEPNRHRPRSPKRPKSELRNVVKGDKQTYKHTNIQTYKHRSRSIIHYQYCDGCYTEAGRQ